MHTIRITLALFAMTSASALGAETEGPVARWEFSEGRDSHIHDTSGHDHHGMASGIKWVEVEDGYAIEFDGAKAHVNCGRRPGLDLRQAVSLEAWVFPTAPATSETGIAGKSIGSYGLTYYTDRNVYWYISSGGNKASAGVPPKRWTHVVGTFDGAKLRLYLNGRLADETETQLKTIKQGGEFLIGTIGHESGGRLRSFRGVIDDVRVYDHSLPGKEILAHYEAEAKRYPRPPAKYDEMIVRVYPYLERGEIYLDLDVSYLQLRPGEGKLFAELRRKGQTESLKRQPLPGLSPSNELRDARVDVGELPPGQYELAVLVETKDGVRGRHTLELDHPRRIRVPMPEERAAPKTPSVPAKVSPPTVHPNGGLVWTIAGKPCRIESTYSYPDGGHNALTASDTKPTGAEPGWRVRIDQKRQDPFHHIRAEGKHYRIHREIRIRSGAAIVRDTISNKGDKPIGILIDNHIRLDGVEGLVVTRYPNPSVFAGKADGGIGLLAWDDVYLEQYATYEDKDRIGIRTDRFALDAKATYTLEWRVYANATGDYFDFVNQARKDLNYQRTIEGGFAFVDRREPPGADYVRNRKLRYASIGCLGHPPDDPTLSLEGIEFVNYPKECALLHETFAETKRRFPYMRTMFHIAHSLYTTNKPKELFPESRVLNAAGVQTDYGGQNEAYYRKYFGEQRVKEGYRWYIFYPSNDNRFGQAMIEAIRFMLDRIGVDSMFADGFSHGYGGRFTYDRWDGHTAEIDPKTKRIRRKYASVNLLAQDVLVKVCRMIAERGGVVIANSYPGTRTIHKEPNLMYCLETAAGGRVCTRLYFVPTVIALGNPADCKTARDVYDDIRDKLEWGGLYFYYGEKEVPPDTIVTRMYPITPVEIRRGLIQGEERIVTTKPGVYGWDDDRLHLVHRYDGRGRPVSHGFFATVTPGAGGSAKTSTDVKLLPDEAAVVERLPIRFRCPKPANVLVRRYDEDRIELVVSASAPSTLVLLDGVELVTKDKKILAASVRGEKTKGEFKAGGWQLAIPAGQGVPVVIRTPGD